MKNAFQKLFIVGFALALNSPAFAEDVVSRTIHLALNTAEQNVTPEHMSDLAFYEKSVGGLTCRRTYSGISRNSSFSCSLDVENRMDRAIYDALAIEETALAPSPAGISVFEKRAYNFACQKKMRHDPNKQARTYRCFLK